MQAAIFPPLEEVCPRLRRCTQWSKQGVHISYKYHSRAAEDFAKNREKSFKKKTEVGEFETEQQKQMLE